MFARPAGARSALRARICCSEVVSSCRRPAAALGKPPRFPGLSTTGPQDSRTTDFPPRNPSATGARPVVLRSFRPVVVRPSSGESAPVLRPVDSRTSGRQDNRLPAPQSFDHRGATCCPELVSSCRRPAGEGGGAPVLRPVDNRTSGRQDNSLSAPQPFGHRGAICCPEVVSSCRRSAVLRGSRPRHPAASTAPPQPVPCSRAILSSPRTAFPRSGRTWPFASAWGRRIWDTAGPRRLWSRAAPA